MYRISIIFLFVFSMLNLAAQVAVTHRDNGLVPGDSSVTREIAWVDPGEAGENVMWDFSAIRYTGKQTFYGVALDQVQGKSAGPAQNMVLSEEGYGYQYQVSDQGITETGYRNPERKMTLDLSDPIVRMKFPLVYGQRFSDPFEGVAWQNENSRIDIAGTYTVTADAWGTLILPDRILKNTLRVKSEKVSLQIGVCGSNQASMVRYTWYAPGCRYPVLMISTTESKYGIKDPVIKKNAWVNTGQMEAGRSTATQDPAATQNESDHAVVVYPNPFTGQVTYNYFLRQQVPVMVELYDISGRFNLVAERKQVRSEGLHAGVIDATLNGLTPGVYYLRFTFDRQVEVHKIVKI